MTKYLLTNISRKPLIVLSTTLASSLTSTTNAPGTLVVEEKELSDYSIRTYLKRGSISLNKLDSKGRIISEDIKEEPEPLTTKEVVEVMETVAEDVQSSLEPTAEIYSEEDLSLLSTSELKSILSSLGVSSNSRKKSTLIKKVMEAQNV